GRPKGNQARLRPPPFAAGRCRWAAPGPDETCGGHGSACGRPGAPTGLGLAIGMQIFERYTDIPAAARGSVLTIGNFDGVHRGHQALLGEVRARARALERPAGALLFEPHPREFFQPDKPHFKLTALPRKLRILERFGVDLVFVLPFDAAFAALTA